MEYYFAPMEGITGYIHRNVHHSLFPGISKYFTAFIAPGQKGKFSAREKNDILPDHNRGICTVPQLLTNNPQDFITTAVKLGELGYREINLNLGCPSRTVVTKYRGSGFLAKPGELDAFFAEVFSACGGEGSLGEMQISVKTRLGVEEPEEFFRILDIYNRYPLKELIIHPRTQRDFYSGPVHMDLFAYGAEHSRCPVCYNGDIRTGEDMRALEERFPALDRVMIGRGLLVDPALHLQLQGGRMPDKAALRTFHDRIYDWYRQEMPGARPVLFKMKELWAYMGQLFEDGRRPLKKIRKAERTEAYEAAVEELFRECHTV
ncbi:tRNA dihydrouridine synthase [Lachnoclostridium sp. An118]|uniref:tRNA dihydrouridine synthase n=1 Tax=Lachnoclostridium sp. An118 TaxID=1965547 RepID=UPI000B3776BC|nr:tRNA-dihydrouridine synthase family protein [Lachnoclostridium sp. An118]OUQ52394.1 diguanylate cyclase [Lachnoclostridium sp. An118]HJA42410.1 tRNA-dihydrouridine synthase family protein [Candidatus Dorea stercoravium]